ncbi:transporter [Sphingobium estronivorans]|uniref:transporter n=1 Tax=Sphingobium estronivorans TaxID=1577690 RepID=UPI00123AC27D|nr:transporter [Sphingobium estronivorans]
MIAKFALATLGLALLPATAQAQLRDFCPERPGLDTPPCIVDKGHFQIEMGLADWTRDRSAGQSTTTVSLGDTELRYGLDDSTEIRANWTAYTRQREHDRVGGERSQFSGVGDLGFSIKHALLNPDGSGFSLAIAPGITLPTGSHGIGDGTWSASFLLPASYALSDSLSLIATPEIDAAADGDGDGRHLAYGSAAGLSADLGPRINASVEMQIIRDRDPGGASTQALSSVSLAFQPGSSLALDAGANFGLNHATPDAEVYIGISRRF